MRKIAISLFMAAAIGLCATSASADKLPNDATNYTFEAVDQAEAPAAVSTADHAIVVAVAPASTGERIAVLRSVADPVDDYVGAASRPAVYAPYKPGDRQHPA